MNYGDLRLPERFWSKCVPEPNSGCWLWIAASSHGYGAIRIDGKTRRAHRLAYEIATGRTDHEDTDHKCRTTNCVNPSHLEGVSHAENMRRSPLGFMSRTTQRELAARSSAVRSMKRCPCGREWSGLTFNNLGQRIRKVCAHCRLMRQRAYTAKKRETERVL